MAPHYDKFIEQTRFSYLTPDAEIDFVHSVLGESQLILDLGCGTGRTMSLMSDKGGNLIGIDVSRQMLVLARRAGLTVLLASAFHLPFSDGVFDAVISIHMGFGFCANNAEARLLSSELFRVLRLGGIMLLDTPHNKIRGDQYITSWSAGGRTIRVMSYGKSREEVEAILGSVGFRGITCFGGYNTNAGLHDDSRRIIVTAVKE
jgi:ubiquinone/menaquinone biosynthesis C-methylase UbiE